MVFLLLDVGTYFGTVRENYLRSGQGYFVTSSNNKTGTVKVNLLE